MIHLHGVWAGSSPRTIQRANATLHKKQTAKLHAQLKQMISEKMNEPCDKRPWWARD